MRGRRPSALVACLSAALCVGAAPPPARERPAARLEGAYERLDAFIARRMREERTPGLAVALTDRRGLLHVGTHGLANLEARIPLTSDRLFEIGSISKSFTAVALLQLRDEGKFDPRAPVVRYLPWFKIDSKHAPITGHKVLQAAYNGKDLPEPPAPESPDKVANAAEFAGAYVSPDGKTLTLVAEGERLILLHGGRRITLERREKDEFYVDDPDFDLYLLRFGRGKGAVVEALYGPDWYANDLYSGPRSFDHPREWDAYPGHYRTTHPWFSNFRIVLRKGKLWLVTPAGEDRALEPAGDGAFLVGEKEHSAERMRFESVIDGKALRANLSGVAYYRSFTP